MDSKCSNEFLNMPIIMMLGKLRLELNPSIGGSISAFEWLGGGAPRSYCANATLIAKMFSTRAASLLFRTSTAFAGVPSTSAAVWYASLRTWRVDPSPLHGQGWLSPWTVDRSDEHSADLHFHHAAGEWPWEYEARQEFLLDERVSR